MKRFTSVRFACFLALSLISAGAAGEDSQKEQVASLVRTLGYGGAIHNFKNYVLRGEEKYHSASQEAFNQASRVLASLGKAQGITAEQRSAVAAVADTVRDYQAQLPTVAQMYKQGKSVEEIDEAVAIGDSAAIKALDTLRKEHNWSKIQDLEFQLGYGSGIHSFKNFILRADEQYRAKATFGLSNVLLIIARYRATEDLAKSQLEALDKIEAVVRKYEEALQQVQTLIGEGKTAQQIDAVVRVDDAPAVKGLAILGQ